VVGFLACEPKPDSRTAAKRCNYSITFFAKGQHHRGPLKQMTYAEIFPTYVSLACMATIDPLSFNSQTTHFTSVEFYRLTTTLRDLKRSQCFSVIRNTLWRLGWSITGMSNCVAQFPYAPPLIGNRPFTSDARHIEFCRLTTTFRPA
jgi:hypothetical protein